MAKLLSAIGLVALCFLVANGAWAQAAPAAEAAPVAEPEGGLEEIIITATKRSVDMQEVPIAVTALTGDDLAARNITNTMDLMGSLPTLQVTTAYGKTQPNFSLRGVSVANEFNSTTASPVGVYVDEVYQSLRASHGGQLFDLDRIEVVRGPQGTLFGRNTTGGAVSFFTKQPTLGEANGEFSAGYANYSTWRLAGAAEYTLIPDVLGVRVAGMVTQGDGYTKDPFDGRDYGTTDSFGARMTLLWAPSDDFKATFKLYTSQDDPRGDAPVGIGQTPSGVDLVGYNRFDPARPKGATPGRALRRNEVEADTQGEYYTSTSGGVLTLNYDFGDAWQFTTITGFDVAHYDLSPFDCDGSPFNVCAIRYDTRSKSWNQDFRVNFTGERMRLVGGFYAGRDRTSTHNQPDFFDTRSAAGFIPAGGMVEPDRHVENPDTKRRLKSLLEVSGLLAQLDAIAPRMASEDEILRVHTDGHLERVKKLSAENGGDAGVLTPFGPGSYEIALLSAGGTLAATDAVLDRRVHNTYALVRPPGHHAESDLGMGFCIFSNIAIAVKHAREARGLGRVAVVDWDVHHGNGTETAFFSDPSVLTISLHQDNYFPAGRGFPEHDGEGAGKGFNLNLPLPPGSGHGAYEAAFARVVVPALRRFQPEAIFVASGFDGGAMDPLGRMLATSATFRSMTRTLLAAADELCGGRLILSHEGGYSTAHVPFCGLAVIEELSGIATGVVDPFLDFFAGMGGQELQPHQDNVIRAAEARLSAIA